MRIEFLRDWPPYRPGQVTEYEHDGAADILIRRGLARPAPAEVKPPTDEPPPAPKPKKGK